jgi:hypothetical protein
MPVIRRRPVLRAAAVGGGAYYAGKRRAEAEEREMSQEARLSGLGSETHPAPPPPPAPGSSGVGDDAIQLLRQLGELHDQGVLTDEEFAQQKTKLLGR